MSGPANKNNSAFGDAAQLLFSLVAVVVVSMMAFNLYRTGFFFIPLLANGFQLPATGRDDDGFRSKCLSFKPDFPGTSTELVEVLPQGASAQLPYRDLTCGGPGVSPAASQDLCRVALYIRTSNRSGIQMEAWLPSEWEGRFLATGNGGLNGCLDYDGLAYATQHGFAAVAANNGHNGTSGVDFYHSSDVLEDFAGRSLHTSVLTGKDIVKQFYGTEHRKSYFLGCSQGGRQGVGSAEKFPDDFDGIVAGAPALDFNNLISWRASFFPLTGPANSSGFIDAETWSVLIHDEVMQQCDALDGVKDGIIEYPELCSFRPETLLCKGDAGKSCLSPEQVEKVRRIFSPLTYPDGTLIYPGMQPGSEQRAVERLYAGKPFTDSQDWFRYVVYSNPSWDPASFTTSDARAASALNPFDIRTFPSAADLRPYRAANRKLLVYHGMQDQQITSFNTARWFEHLQASSDNATDAEIDTWARYFRISGMYHCSKGPGAWAIGQVAGGVPFDSRFNVLAAIVRWVEEGIAPETMEGTKFKDDDLRTVEFKRRHCRYPKRNRYSFAGTQDQALLDALQTSSQAEDWTCV